MDRSNLEGPYYLRGEFYRPYTVRSLLIICMLHIANVIVAFGEQA